MAEIHKIEQIKEADRRIALLALAASKKQDEQTACLTADEMATLVDRQCSSDEQERYFAHLADCEICYRQWLELSELTQAGATEKNIAKLDKLFSRRYFGWTGTALAAAASVVLFLNITRDAQRPMIQQNKPPKAERSFAPSSTVGQKEKQSDFKEMPAEQNFEELKDAAPLEMEDQAPAPAPPRKELRNAGKSVLTKKQKTQPTALKADVQMRGIHDDISTESFAKGSGDPGRVEVDVWIQRIQQGCRNGEEQTRFWQQQYLQGEQLIQRAAFTTPEEEKLVHDIVSLVVQMRDAPTTRRAICKRIQDRCAAISKMDSR